MNLSKKLALLLSASLALAGLGACESDPGRLEVTKLDADKVSHTQITPLKDQTLTWSNLASRPARDQIRKLLVESGLTAPRVTPLLAQIDQFNEIANYQGLVLSGFKTQKGPADYSKLVIAGKWQKKFPKFAGYNCRMTSFTAMGDLVTVGFGQKGDDSVLFPDKEAIANDPQHLISDKELEKYSVLYSKIPTPRTKDPEVHIKSITDFRKKKELTFNDAIDVSMIQVFTHTDLGGEPPVAAVTATPSPNGSGENGAPLLGSDAAVTSPENAEQNQPVPNAPDEPSADNLTPQPAQPAPAEGTDSYLIVGHTGLWVPDGSGGYLFLEKLNFDEPYQLMRFASPAHLYQYLMAKYDDSQGQPYAAPIIFENNHLFVH